MSEHTTWTDRQLPPKRAARLLLKAVSAGETDAVLAYSDVIRTNTQVSLMRCQHVIAVRRGFKNWAELLRDEAKS